MTSTAFSKPRRTLVVGAVALAAGLTLAACGGSSSGTTTSSSAASAPSGPAGGNTGPAARPGAAGQVAAISGTTMQVQSQQAGQVAVSWTSSTTFVHPVTAKLSTVKAGDCVIATASSPSSASSFTATALSVSKPVNGQCGGGAGGAGRAGGVGTGQRPGPRPNGLPSGAPGRPGAGAFATGTVSSVAGSTIVIAAQQPGSNGSTTNRTVTVGSKTKVSSQKSTTAKSLKVGLCVSAQGNADSTGTVTATSVRISNPVNGQCAVGFGGVNSGD